MSCKLGINLFINNYFILYHCHTVVFSRLSKAAESCKQVLESRMITAASFSKVTCYYSCLLLKASCTSEINECTLPWWLENSQLHFSCHVAMKKPICSFPAAYENPLNTREAG
jgi:hypothetical protein